MFIETFLCMLLTIFRLKAASDWNIEKHTYIYTRNLSSSAARGIFIPKYRCVPQRPPSLLSYGLFKSLQFLGAKLLYESFYP